MNGAGWNGAGIFKRSCAERRPGPIQSRVPDHFPRHSGTFLSRQTIHTALILGRTAEEDGSRLTMSQSHDQSVLRAHCTCKCMAMVDACNDARTTSSLITCLVPPSAQSRLGSNPR